MRLAHLLLVHDHPQQLERLLQRLHTENADIYIQLDKKSNIANYGFARVMHNVFFIEARVKVYSGTFSVVQATLNGMEEILSKSIGYSHINLLSAQDYPLRKAEHIEDFLLANADKTFMHSLSMEDECQEDFDRFRKYCFADYKFPGQLILQQLLGFFKIYRKLPAGLKACAGSRWLTITPECASYVIGYLKRHPAVRRYFRMSFAPDRFIFQTILANSPLSHKLVDDNLRYIDFSQSGYPSRSLTADDAFALITSDKLYARKFDAGTDNDLLDFLDDIAADAHQLGASSGLPILKR